MINLDLPNPPKRSDKTIEKASAQPSIRDLLLADGFGSELSAGIQNLTYHRLSRTAYESIVWVHRCVRIIADNVSAVPISVRRDGKQLDENDPINLLLTKPEPGVMMREWVERWCLHMLLGGEAWAEIIRGQQGVPIAMQLLQPDRLIITENDLKITDISYSDLGTQGQRTLMLDDLQCWKFPNPIRPERGISPLVSSGNAIMAELQSAEYLEAFFRNAARPSGVLTIPTAVTPSMYQRVAEQLRQSFSGKNAHRPMVFGQDAKWTTIASSHRDMELSQVRMDQAKQVAASLGVPPFMVGIFEPKFENYRASVESFWLETLVPILRRLCGGIENILSASNPELEVEPDLSKTPAGRTIFAQKLENAKALQELGLPLEHINDALELGLEDLPEGLDEPLVPGTMVPLSMLLDGGGMMGEEPGGAGEFDGEEDEV